LLATVTRSDTLGGVSPATPWPKLMLGRSSAIDKIGWMSMSTPAFPETPSSGGGAAAQRARAAAELRGAGAWAEKSVAFVSVSVHAPSTRTAATVLLIAGAGPFPS
jgi:hypothetical protein